MLLITKNFPIVTFSIRVSWKKQIIELKDEIIKLQKELNEKNLIIEKDKGIIKDLQDKLKIQNNNQTSNLNKTNITNTPITPNKSFNILEKEVIFKVDDLGAQYFTIYILQDGRIAAGGYSNSIIIYNKESFKSELTIKEHSSYIMYLTQLRNGNFVSLGND